MLRRRRVRGTGWACHNDAAGPVHVWPLNDAITHDTDTLDCICGPHVEYVHPDTAEAHDQPLVTHHSLDGRERRERTHG